MNFSTYIARRYFFSKKSGNAVNIISAVSMLGIMVGTASLIIVLSAFNGLEGLVKGFYQTFDPDIKSSIVRGKYFSMDSVDISSFEKLDGIETISMVLEERVLLTFRDREYIASLKGVDSNFRKVSDVGNSLIAGYYNVSGNNEVYTGIIGAGVSYFLGYSRLDMDSPISVYVPRENSGPDFSRAFASEKLYPTGIFRIQPDFDDRYVITDMGFVQGLLNRENAATSIEFRLHPEADVARIQESISAMLGSNFKTQNREEQQEILLKVMRSENLFTFLVFALILAISTFTIMGSIIMLMLDKKDNIYTLWACGTSLESLQQIFFKTGLFICLAGAFSGLALGIGVIILQDNFGILSLGPGYALDAYPVDLEPGDVLLVSVTVLALSSITSWFTSRRLSTSLFKPAIG